MTGSTWLRDVFEPAIDNWTPMTYPTLAGALDALVLCGVLSAQEFEGARGRLLKALEASEIAPCSAPPTVRAPQADAAAVKHVLEAVLTPAHPLVDIDGVTLVLVSVELWTAGVAIRFAGLRTSATDKLGEQRAKALKEWANSDRRAAVPEPPGAVILKVPLRLSDDAGTVYRPTHRSAGGTGSQWRSEWRFEPGVPASATHIMVSIEGADGRRHEHRIARPER